jgi:hypothetical protein
VFRKFFILSDFVELFSLIILEKKTFWNSLRNDGIIVKILNIVKYRVFQIICFANISAQSNDKGLAFLSKDAP